MLGMYTFQLGGMFTNVSFKFRFGLLVIGDSVGNVRGECWW